MSTNRGPSSTDLAAQLAAVTEDRRRIVEVTDRLNRDRLRDLADLQRRLDAIVTEARRGLGNGPTWLPYYAESVLTNIVNLATAEKGSQPSSGATP